MSSMAMPLATRLPRNGGLNTGLSVATSGERAGQALAPGHGPRPRPGVRSSLLRGPRSRPPRAVPNSGSSSPLRRQLDQAVHGAEALEGVLAVEEAPVVDLAQVALDVGAGERGAAQDHRDVGQAAPVELLEVVAHDERRLDQQAAHADGVGIGLLEGGRPCR